jgi:hypothetical protein
LYRVDVLELKKTFLHSIIGHGIRHLLLGAEADKKAGFYFRQDIEAIDSVFTEKENQEDDINLIQVLFSEDIIG